MTQFTRKTIVAQFFVISSIMIVLTGGTKIKSNHYSVWHFQQTSVKSAGNGGSDETTNVTFDVKIRASTGRHKNNALENQYNLLVKFENVSQLWFLNNNDHAEDNYESHRGGNIHVFGLKLGAEGQCRALYTTASNNEIELKRAIASLLFPDPYYKIIEMARNPKNSLSDCFEETPLGSCKTFVHTIYQEGGIVINKHTNADYCDEELPVFESLSKHARPSISPDSSVDVKYLIDQTDNKLSRVEMLFKINYPSESVSVKTSYVLAYTGFERYGDKDSYDAKALTVNNF